MASQARTFGGFPAGDARGYLADFPARSSMPPVPPGDDPLPESLRAPHLTQWRNDPGVVECAEKELQSGTKQPENLLAAIPESDATAADGFSKADIARGLGEHAVKGNALITYERVAMTMGVALQVVIAALVGFFWWSFTTTVADVKSLQGDVRTIMVEAGKATTALDGKIDNLATSLGGKIDNLGTTLGGRIDTLTASNAGQFELVTQRLDDLIASKPKR